MFGLQEVLSIDYKEKDLFSLLEYFILEESCPFENHASGSLAVCGTRTSHYVGTLGMVMFTLTIFHKIAIGADNNLCDLGTLRYLD